MTGAIQVLTACRGLNLPVTRQILYLCTNSCIMYAVKACFAFLDQMDTHSSTRNVDVMVISFIRVPSLLAVYRMTLELPTLMLMTRLQCLSHGQHLLWELERWKFDLLLSWYDRLTGLTNLQTPCRVSVDAVVDTCRTPTWNLNSRVKNCFKESRHF